MVMHLIWLLCRSWFTRGFLPSIIADSMLITLCVITDLCISMTRSMTSSRRLAVQVARQVLEKISSDWRLRPWRRNIAKAFVCSPLIIAVVHMYWLLLRSSAWYHHSWKRWRPGTLGGILELSYYASMDQSHSCWRDSEEWVAIQGIELKEYHSAVPILSNKSSESQKSPHTAFWPMSAVHESLDDWLFRRQKSTGKHLPFPSGSSSLHISLGLHSRGEPTSDENLFTDLALI